MSVARRPRLTAKDAEDFAGRRYRTASGSDRTLPLSPQSTSQQLIGPSEVEWQHPVAIARGSVTINLRIFLLLSFAMLTACQAASSREPASVSALTLAEEYERSSAVVRSKYDGKEIIVRGYVLIAATMPPSGNDQAEQFSRIKGRQYITVKGIFNGEAGVELKFCKLVKAGSESD